jgi:uncharacterized protein YndB with AHSA1/START domain
MTYQFTLTDVIPASPETIYDAWLDSRGHTAMTGGKAKMSKRVGGKLSTWDGYISGQNIELVPGKRIVQSWRTTWLPTPENSSILRTNASAPLAPPKNVIADMPITR